MSWTSESLEPGEKWALTWGQALVRVKVRVRVGDLCSGVLRGAEWGRCTKSTEVPRGCGKQGLVGTARWAAHLADPKRGGSPPNSPGQRVKLWEQSMTQWGWHAVVAQGGTSWATRRWPSCELARGPREDVGASAGDSWGTGRRARSLAEVQASTL